MTDDLVKRLRDLGDHASFEPHMHHVAADRIEQLEEALRTLIKSCDVGCSMDRIGVSGMTVSTNIKSSWVNNVEAWAVEEARAALAGEKKDENK